MSTVVKRVVSCNFSMVVIRAGQGLLYLSVELTTVGWAINKKIIDSQLFSLNRLFSYNQLENRLLSIN